MTSPDAAADSMLAERASAAVTGQIVVEISMVSVIRAVETPSGRLVEIAEMAGQSVIVGAQLKTVWIDVARTVRVVSCSPLAEAMGMVPPLKVLVEAATDIGFVSELASTDKVERWLVVIGLTVMVGKTGLKESV